MGRGVMDGGMRRIKRAPAPSEVDQTLLLVAQFAASRIVPLPEGSPEPAPASQEAAGQPVADETENYPDEAQQGAEQAHASENEVSEPDAAPAVADEDDFDPIAAVLG